MLRSSILLLSIYALTQPGNCLATQQNLNGTGIKDNISTIRVAYLPPTKKLFKQVYPKEHPNGGLLGVIITYELNKSKFNREQSKIEPFNSLLSERDVAKEMYFAVKESIHDLAWAKINQVDYIEDVKNFDLKKYAKSIEEDALLIVKTKINITPNYGIVEFFGEIELYEKVRRLKKIYANKLFYQSKNYGSYKTYDMSEIQDELNIINEIYETDINKKRRSKDIRLAKKKRSRAITKLKTNAKIKGSVNSMGAKWLYDNTGEFLNIINVGIPGIAKLIVLDLNDSADLSSDTDLNMAVIFSGMGRTRAIFEPVHDLKLSDDRRVVRVFCCGMKHMVFSVPYEMPIFSTIGRTVYENRRDAEK